MILFPRLPHYVAAGIAEVACSLSVEDLANKASAEHPSCEFTPTGGTRATTVTLLTLRRDLLQLAVAGGYPRKPSQQQAATFDAHAAMVLGSQMSIAPAEAALGGIWEFLSCVLLPDIVRWRFAGDGQTTSIDRFVSGRRNTYQRLWWRAFHLSPRAEIGRPFSELLLALGEDELVQLMERPSVAGIEGLPNAIADGLLIVSAQHPTLPRRQLIREAQKRFLRLSSFIAFESLATHDVARHVEAVFSQVVASLGDRSGY